MRKKKLADTGSAWQRVYARFVASRRGMKTLNSSRDKNEGTRSRGGGSAHCVTPDLSYDREGAGEVGRR